MVSLRTKARVGSAHRVHCARYLSGLTQIDRKRWDGLGVDRPAGPAGPAVPDRQCLRLRAAKDSVLSGVERTGPTGGGPARITGCGEQAGAKWGERVTDRTTEKDRGSGPGGDVSAGVSHGGLAESDSS
jgi:hypothetical protein